MIPILDQLSMVVQKLNGEVTQVTKELTNLEDQKTAYTSPKRLFQKKTATSDVDIERLDSLIKLRHEQIVHDRDWKNEAARWVEVLKRATEKPIPDETKLEYLQTATQRYGQWQNICKYYDKQCTK